jgi:hypothetical protein
MNEGIKRWPERVGLTVDAEPALAVAQALSGRQILRRIAVESGPVERGQVEQPGHARSDEERAPCAGEKVCAATRHGGTA